MAKKPNRPPELLNVNGVMHKLTVFKIVEKNEDGTPWQLELMRDSDVAEIVGDEEFMTGYVRAHMLRPEKK